LSIFASLQRLTGCKPAFGEKEAFHLQNDQFSFIVHIWREAEDRENDISTWRGSIDDVSSNKRLYFNDLDGITRFIEEQVGNKAGNSKAHRIARLAYIGKPLLATFQRVLTSLRFWNRHDRQS
jgi:hypothetical protein